MAPLSHSIMYKKNTLCTNYNNTVYVRNYYGTMKIVFILSQLKTAYAHADTFSLFFFYKKYKREKNADRKEKIKKQKKKKQIMPLVDATIEYHINDSPQNHSSRLDWPHPWIGSD